MKKLISPTLFSFCVLIITITFAGVSDFPMKAIEFYTVGSIVILFILLCGILLIIKYKKEFKIYLILLMFGSCAFYVFTLCKHQAENYKLENIVDQFLPNASLKIIGEKQKDVFIAEPMEIQKDQYKDEQRVEGEFFPRLPYHLSEVVLLHNNTNEFKKVVSYKFVFKKSYSIDNEEVTKKACYAWKVCNYFFHGYVDMDESSGEVINLKIQYRDLK